MAIYKLKDMINVISGNPKYTKKYIQNNKGIYPVISSSAFNNGIYGYINTFDYEKGTTISKDGSIGNVFFQNSKFSLYGAFLIKPNEDKILEKYLFYFLKSKEFYLKSIGVGSVIKHIYRYHIDNIKINLPSHETQRSIIEIIEPLKKQIDLINLKINMIKNYFKYKLKYLFSNKNFTEIYQLNDLVNIFTGKSKYTIDFVNANPGQFNVYSSKTANNGIFGKINNYDFSGEFILITTHGKYAGTIKYVNEKFSTTSNCFILEKSSSNINLRYLYFELKQYEKTLNLWSIGSAHGFLTNKILNSFKIFVPSLEVQQSLISIIEPLYRKIELLEQKKILLEKRFNFYINFLIKKR